MTDQLSNFDLSAAKITSPLFAKGAFAGSKSVILPQGFPEATLYALLKSLFGPPKGFMSLAIGPKGDPDAPFKYEFVIELPDNTKLSIVRSWLNLEIRAYGRTIQQSEIVRMFTHNFSIHATKLKEAQDALEAYRLIINPHARHKRMMDESHKRLSSTHPVEPTYPQTLKCSAEEQRSWSKQMKAYVLNMHEQSSLAISTVMESAYTAESLLNLFIAILRKPVLVESPNLLRDALLEKWKDKIERLPLHCDHVTNPPDMEHAAVKGIEKVFNRRNRVAHSYPDIDALCVANIWFDVNIPLLPNCGPYVGYQLGADAVLPSRPDSLECPALVNQFETYMYGLLHPDIRDEMQLLAKSNPIGYSEKTKRYGVPFAEQIFMALFPQKVT